MKRSVKALYFLIAVFFIFTTACGSEGSIESISISGQGISNNAVTRYMSLGTSYILNVKVTSSGNISTAVTWSSSDTSVATVSNKGEVELLKEGKTNITVTASADTSKKTAIELFVIDDRSSPPGYPDGEHVMQLDKNAAFQASTTLETGAIVFVSKSQDITTIEYNSNAAKSNWQNYTKITVSSRNYERSTKFGINVQCIPSGIIYFKLVNSMGKMIWEGDLNGDNTWTSHIISLSFVERAALGNLRDIYIYTPKPGTSMSAGVVKVNGIWLDGQDIPAVIPSFSFNENKIIGSVDLSEPNPAGITQSGIVPGTNNNLVINFNNDGFSANNTGYNDWKVITYVFSNEIDYSNARWIVFEMGDISGRGLIKYKLMDESLREVYPVTGTQYYALYYPEGELANLFTAGEFSYVYIQIAPSYLDTTSTASFRLNGIHILDF